MMQHAVAFAAQRREVRDVICTSGVVRHRVEMMRVQLTAVAAKATLETARAMDAERLVSRPTADQFSLWRTSASPEIRTRTAANVRIASPSTRADVAVDAALVPGRTGVRSSPRLGLIRCPNSIATEAVLDPIDRNADPIGDHLRAEAPVTHFPKPRRVAKRVDTVHGKAQARSPCEDLLVFGKRQLRGVTQRRPAACGEKTVLGGRDDRFTVRRRNSKHRLMSGEGNVLDVRMIDFARELVARSQAHSLQPRAQAIPVLPRAFGICDEVRAMDAIPTVRTDMPFDAESLADAVDDRIVFVAKSPGCFADIIESVRLDVVDARCPALVGPRGGAVLPLTIELLDRHRKAPCFAAT